MAVSPLKSKRENFHSRLVERWQVANKLSPTSRRSGLEPYKLEGGLRSSTEKWTHPFYFVTTTFVKWTVDDGCVSKLGRCTPYALRARNDAP